VADLQTKKRWTISIRPHTPAKVWEQGIFYFVEHSRNSLEFFPCMVPNNQGLLLLDGQLTKVGVSESGVDNCFELGVVGRTNSIIELMCDRVVQPECGNTMLPGERHRRGCTKQWMECFHIASKLSSKKKPVTAEQEFPPRLRQNPKLDNVVHDG